KQGLARSRSLFRQDSTDVTMISNDFSLGATSVMRRITGLLTVLFIFSGTVSASADALERMRMERLRATHERVLALAGQRVPVELKSGFDDVRSLLHVHSAFSHDSRG